MRTIGYTKEVVTRYIIFLHAAHQGQTSMESRIADSVWWPEQKAVKAVRRAKCTSCDKVAPSQILVGPLIQWRSWNIQCSMCVAIFCTCGILSDMNIS